MSQSPPSTAPVATNEIHGTSPPQEDVETSEHDVEPGQGPSEGGGDYKDAIKRCFEHFKALKRSSINVEVFKNFIEDFIEAEFQRRQSEENEWQKCVLETCVLFMSWEERRYRTEQKSTDKDIDESEVKEYLMALIIRYLNDPTDDPGESGIQTTRLEMMAQKALDRKFGLGKEGDLGLGEMLMQVKLENERFVDMTRKERVWWVIKTIAIHYLFTGFTNLNDIFKEEEVQDIVKTVTDNETYPEAQEDDSIPKKRKRDSPEPRGKKSVK